MERSRDKQAVPTRFGKKPPVIDTRTLRFGKYVHAKLTRAPPAITWGRNIRRWPLYLNNKFADCTCAAAAHLIENWTAAFGREVVLTTDQVLEFYRHFTKPGSEGDCAVLSVLKFWRSHGLAGHKILAFAQLERRNINEIRQAVAIFGGCYVGLALPKFAAVAQNPRDVPWVVPREGLNGNAAPDPQFGHCVAGIAYDEQSLHVVSWGKVKTMSWEFYSDYSDEAYVLLSNDFLSKKKTPAGFDLSQLRQDLATVEKTRS